MKKESILDQVMDRVVYCALLYLVVQKLNLYP
jgi:hypothetical protein